MLKVTRNPIFQPPPEQEQRELHERTALTRTTKRRELVNGIQSRNALKDVQALPGPEESLHVIARGNFPLWQIVPAVLTMAAPATIAHLAIATLGFSKSNAADLFALLDASQVQAVDLVCSVYFERQNPAEFQMMSDGLKERGQKMAVLRSHAKIITMLLTNGQGFTVESSANLRSCRNLEQLTLTNSEPLRTFHAAWIQQVIKNAR